MGRIVFVGQEPMTKDHIWGPLAREFELNGWETIFCQNGTTFGDIGFYCEDRSVPGNQKFTIITINGLDQDHVIRPFYSHWFEKENWGLFDLGMLPGNRWYIGWITRYRSFKNTPRLGVIPVGHFKGDKAVNQHSRPFTKKNVSTVLYAPQTEQDGKQRLVVEAAHTAGLTLKIKHWENEQYTKLFPKLLTPAYMQNLADENNFAKKFGNVEIYPTEENFMDTLSEVDLLITDQSSVLYEAAMLNIPTLTCIGWKHACGTCRGPQPSPDITVSVNPEELRNTLENIQDIYPELLRKTKIIRDQNFVYLGNSAQVAYTSIIDIHKKAPTKSYAYKVYLKHKLFVKSIDTALRRWRKKK